MLNYVKINSCSLVIPKKIGKQCTHYFRRIFLFIFFLDDYAVVHQPCIFFLKLYLARGLPGWIQVYLSLRAKGTPPRKEKVQELLAGIGRCQAAIHDMFLFLKNNCIDDSCNI